MTRRKYRRSRSAKRDELLLNCGQVNEDDQIDPREYFKPPKNVNKTLRKAYQLCRQVEQTLGLVLGDCHPDSILALMDVVSVIPAPDSSRLLVTLSVDVEPESYNHADALAGLYEHNSRLRSEVAQSINRKKTPVLVYNLIGPIDPIGTLKKEADND